MKAWRRHAGVGLALLLAAWGVWRCWPHTLDDGFVFLRYARNLLDGQGLVFNPGERVEGHSNTLWLLWLGLGGAPGAPLLGWAKLSGTAALLALIGAAWWLLRRITSALVPAADPGAQMAAALLATCAIATHPGAAYYATSAMGTTLVMLLLLLAAGTSALDLLSAQAAPAADAPDEQPASSAPVRADKSQPKKSAPKKSKATKRHAAKSRKAKRQAAKAQGKKFQAAKSKDAANSSQAPKSEAAPPTQAASPSRYARLFVAATALLCLTRPEAPLLWLSLCAPRLWLHRRTPSRRNRELAYAAVTLAPFIALSIWRYAYYGSWLPNTYAAKPSTLLSHPGGAFRYLADSGTALGWGLLLVLLVALLQVARGCLADKRQRLLAATLGWPIAAQLLFTLYSGGDWMPHGRFMLVVVPLLWLLAAIALLRVADYKLMAAAAAVAVLLQAWSARTFWREMDENSVHDHALRSDGNVAMARWMKQNLPAGSTVVADEIGALGYHSELRIFDMWGLVDREIAAELSARRFNPYNSPIGTRERRDAIDAISTKLLARNPDYIIIDYRAPAPPPGAAFDRRFFMPYTMSGFAVNMGPEYHLVRAFPLMTNPPKTFLLLGRAVVASAKR